MTDAALYYTWFVSLAVAGVVVVIAAALLLAVLSTARSIEQGAATALEQVGAIRENTLSIWALQETNEVAAQLESGAEAILQNAGQIAQALHDSDVRRGRSIG